MDPVTLIIAALAAGAAAGLQDTAGQAVRDAYNGLKSLLQRRLEKQPVAQIAIDKHEQSPEVWEKPLQDELERAGLGEDEEVLKMAQQLLAIVDPAGSERGKYTVTISGGNVGAVGDHAHVQMTFDDRD